MGQYAFCAHETKRVGGGLKTTVVILADDHAGSPLGAAEFTAAMFAEINGCGPSTAARILQGALKSGRITCVGHRLHLGRKNKAFRFS